jgi:hypothetical protein
MCAQIAAADSPSRASAPRWLHQEPLQRALPLAGEFEQPGETADQLRQCGAQGVERAGGHQGLPEIQVNGGLVAVDVTVERGEPLGLQLR